jgi:hypothetical protein
MRRAFGLALALATALAAAAASSPAPAADCPPPEALLIAVRGATRVQLEQLGSDAQRVETSLAHVPGRTLGYEVQGVFRASAPVANALRDAFSRHDSYACTKDLVSSFQAPAGLPIGLWFGSGPQAVAVVLHLPEGEVELQREGEARVRVPLSRAGQRRWELALLTLARETRTSPEEFYRQMTPPDRVHAEPPASPDTASSPK